MVVRRVTLPALWVVLVCAFGLVFLGWEGHGPLAGRFGVVTEQLTPDTVLLPGPGMDPLVVTVGFKWPKPGYCVGEFHVAATETDARVIVSQVQRRVPRGDLPCAGVGSSGRAFVPLRLKAPLGVRPMFRAVDGKQLTVTKHS
jgi:hypothetical protein